MPTEIIENTGERMVPELSDASTFWEHVSRYQFAARWVTGKRVLDIASGEGYGAHGLREAGAKNVIGVDINESVCRYAAAKYKLDVRLGSAEAIPLDAASTDVLVSFETIEHVAHPEAFIEEAFRVLSPGGVLIISTPDKDLYSPPGKELNPYHCSEMTRDEFRCLLEKKFSNVTLYGQRPQTAKWWSPIALIAERSPWDRIPLIKAFRRRAWNKWSLGKIRSVQDSDRHNPSSRIANPSESGFLMKLDWSAIRPLHASKGWDPVFLIAVAHKV